MAPFAVNPSKFGVFSCLFPLKQKSPQPRLSFRITIMLGFTSCFTLMLNWVKKKGIYRPFKRSNLQDKTLYKEMNSIDYSLKNLNIFLRMFSIISYFHKIRKYKTFLFLVKETFNFELFQIK
jgi:hypothetical protein